MRRKISNILFIFLTAMFFISACNLGAQEISVVETEVLSTQVPPTNVPTEVVPTTIVHQVTPGEFPEEASGVVGDQDSSLTADKKRAPGGDRFTFTRFERPFNSNDMDEYYPFIDIQEGVLFQDDTWIYVVITLKNNETSQELKGRYGFEVDLDLDGGGDYLILASNPISTEWTTNGVEVWFDTNDDVGGEIPTTTDSVSGNKNGYETLTFGLNVGNDPDLAWVRISPENPNIVHLAVKQDILIGNAYMVGFWAGNEDLDPALFDISDHFSHEQAGAAMTELEYFYPIKEVSALDNTCRMAVGFQPTGNEPGLCPLPNIVVDSETPLEPGCPAEFLVCRQPITYSGPPICVCNQP